MNALFICSRNQWRSPTAAKVFATNPDLNVRSAGTSPKARRTVTAGDLQWADTVFVMEEKHLHRLQARFPAVVRFKPVHVLEIPDDFRFMDPELIDLLIDAVTPHL